MESLGHLTGGVAHDFNNLLMAVLGNLNLLRKRLPADPRTARLVEGAIQGAERGATLTKRMLAFARRQQLKPEAVDVGRLMQGMVDLLRRSLGPAIDIQMDIPAGLPAILADPNQLELAVLNLAVNARDAMPVGGRLSITASCAHAVDGAEAPGSGNFICLAVSDSGTGMDDATLKRATEPFFTTKGVGKGTGLGLSMVHGLAAQSGGSMRISSRPGAGTTVELWLPSTAAAAATAAPQTVPASLLPGGTMRSCRVLVVDDDPLIRASTASMLEDLGHTVIEAASAVRALEALRSGSEVDLVLTDHAMPGMNGLELALQIEAAWPNLPVLLATGYAELSDGQLAGRAHLLKPYRQEELAMEMVKLLDRGSSSNVIQLDASRRG
jgi:CheY-like chemotaxis protein